MNTILSENVSNQLLVEEPLKDFCHFKRIHCTVIDPLKLFYNNPELESATCQLHILDCYEEKIKIAETSACNLKIWDRGIDSADGFTKTVQAWVHN